MPRVRVTRRDSELAHQIVLTHSSLRPATHLDVSCNCRRRKGNKGHVPFATISVGDDPWQHYNNPENHLTNKEAFVPGKHYGITEVRWVK